MFDEKKSDGQSSSSSDLQHQAGFRSTINKVSLTARMGDIMNKRPVAPSFDVTSLPKGAMSNASSAISPYGAMNYSLATELQEMCAREAKVRQAVDNVFDNLNKYSPQPTPAPSTLHCGRELLKRVSDIKSDIIRFERLERQLRLADQILATSTTNYIRHFDNKYFMNTGSCAGAPNQITTLYASLAEEQLLLFGEVHGPKDGSYNSPGGLHAYVIGHIEDLQKYLARLTEKQMGCDGAADADFVAQPPDSANTHK
ncbi:MAG: hypothetical protein H6623_03395 [Bdellovibrionaceae bacterium]|nr:hypothetical protein [Pseudobdellovibrionaceae bacterium]